MSVVVATAAAAVTALGGLGETWEGLLAGEEALAAGNLAGPLGKWPAGVIDSLEGAPGSAERQGHLISKILQDLPDISADCRLIVSTTKGAPDELLGGKPAPWPGQPWSLGELIREAAGITGPVSIISGACASGTIAVIQAAQHLLSDNEAKEVLVIGMDLFSSFVVSGFARLHALSGTRCRPFDQGRDGLSLGEGAGALLLSTAAEAQRRGLPVLARINGWGVSCDADHITAPCREASGLKRALGLCTAGDTKQVGAINAHGTGTRFNDAMEVKAFRDKFGEEVPVHSIKGAIGHCLGGAGVIEAAVATKSLEKGLIPPTIGLGKPEEGINISGTDPLGLLHPSIISCNSGFGGINAAVRFERFQFSGDNRITSSNSTMMT